MHFHVFISHYTERRVNNLEKQIEIPLSSLKLESYLRLLKFYSSIQYTFFILFRAPSYTRQYLKKVRRLAFFS